MAKKFNKYQKVLREIKDLLKKHGWTQGAYKNHDGLCLVGALYEACSRVSLTDRPIQAEVQTYISDAVGETAGHCTTITAWNDNENRTKKQVLKMLDLAIEKAAVQ